MLYRILALVALFTCLNTAFADEIRVEKTCDLSSMTLEKETQVFCDGTLNVAPGTVIDTHGFFFQIVSTGGAELGAGAGLTIDSNGKAGIVSIYITDSMSGQLNVRNQNAEDGMGDSVEITVGAFTLDYQQSVTNGLGGNTTVIAGGEELILDGPQNNIARN
jgi:hypothetical protein